MKEIEKDVVSWKGSFSLTLKGS